jgi:hypothetical protein
MARDIGPCIFFESFLEKKKKKPITLSHWEKSGGKKIPFLQFVSGRRIQTPFAMWPG